MTETLNRDFGVPEGLHINLPTVFSPENRERLSGPGLRAFLNVSNQWGLSERQKLLALGDPARSTFHKWARDAEGGRPVRLSLDILVRISAILGIHKALRILFLSTEDSVAWMSTPNYAPVFGGQRPIDLVVSGFQDSIMQVRRHLDARRGGIFASPTEADFENQIWRVDDIVVAE